MAAAVHGAGWTKWAVIPAFLFWILIALFIWLFLLCIAKILAGIYGSTEIAMAIVFATAGAIGIGGSLRQASDIPNWGGLLIFVVVVALQIGVMMISLRYPISDDATLIAWLQDNGVVAGGLRTSKAVASTFLEVAVAPRYNIANAIHNRSSDHGRSIHRRRSAHTARHR